MWAGRLAEQFPGAWSRLPGNVRGAIWMLLASACLSAMAASMKLIGQSMSPWEVLVLRSLVALAILAPAVLRSRFLLLKTNRPGAHFLRGFFGTAAFACYFVALTHSDLTLTVTLGFTRNLFVILLATIFLGEIIGWRRGSATLVGFIGVAICLEPSAENFNPWALFALGFAAFGALVTVIIKKLTSSEQPITILFYLYSYMAVLSLIPAILTWRTPQLLDMVLIGFMALLSTLGQTCLVKGLQAGDTTAVTPFEYSRILYAFVFGFILFGDIPSFATWIGGAIIIVSTAYIALRNFRSGKNVTSEPPPKAG